MLRRQLLRQTRAICNPETLLPRAPSSSFSQLRQHTTPRYSSAFPPRIWQRYQSTEATKESTDPNSVATGESPQDTSKAAETPAENPLQKDLDAKSKEVVALKDQYLRSVADYRNLQDRTKRDMDSARQFAIQRFATDLLDSIDNLDRALQTVPEASLQETPTPNPDSDSAEAMGTHAADLRALHSGLKMTEEILLNTLRKHGVERFDPAEGEGRKFDPNLDEATFFMKAEGRGEGEIFHTQSKGFTLNGRVIRAAKVGVVKNS